MPRKQNMPIQDRITAKEEELAKLTEKVKTLKDEIAALKKEKEADDYKKIVAAIKESGMNTEEALALFAKSKEAPAAE